MPAPALGAAAVLGAGTALVYPTLLAAVSDAVAPGARARAVAVYRFWRDVGLVVGAAGVGLAADSLGSAGTIAIVATITAASGVLFYAATTENRRQAEGGRRWQLI